jgi:hypothetical protein
MNSLALLVQENLYVFRGKSGKPIEILWHDGMGMSLYAKRLERGPGSFRQAHQPPPGAGGLRTSPTLLERKAAIRRNDLTKGGMRTKVLSMELVVRRCLQCSAGKS